MKFEIIKEFEKVPYTEDTKSWHIWLDIFLITNGEVGDIFTLNQLCTESDLDESYYDFSELLEDGYIIRTDI